MPRPISPDLLTRLENAEESLGVSLGKLCVRAGLPLLYAAAMLDVSRMTLHTWVRGGKVRSDHAPKVEKFIQYIEDELQAGVLPMKTLWEAREYAESFCGRPILPPNKKAEITALKSVA